MLDLKGLGARIRQLRTEQGLTQGEFADRLSVSFQAVSNWERAIAPPDVENLIRIAAHFGVLVDSLLSSVTEELYLGIDGGGTKTEFAVVSADGRVYHRVVTAGCNPNDIGFERTEAQIVEGIQGILAQYPSVKAIFGGIAGMSTGTYAEQLHTALKGRYPKIKIQIQNDARNLFALCDEADMAVISGTGSVVFAKQDQTYARIGGWGYLFDRAGSAYDIGRDAIAQALAEEDRLQSPSELSRMLCQKMNTATVWAHVNALYRGGRPYIAGFASVAFEAYARGDENAIRIIDQNARALAEHLNTGVRTYGAKPIAVASGGLFEHYPDVMTRHIAAYSDVCLKLCDLPPIYGACRNACRVASAHMSDTFYENFQKTYGGLPT